MIIEEIQFQVHQDIKTQRRPEDSWIWRTVSTFFCFFSAVWSQDSAVYLFLSAINTHRILTEDPLSSSSTRQSQENKLILKHDPLCGLTVGGKVCTLDCDVHPNSLSLGSVNIYSDPTCLSDCGQYPACSQQLYKDFETAGRVGIIKQSISWFTKTKFENIKILLFFSATSDIRRSLCWE